MFTLGLLVSHMLLTKLYIEKNLRTPINLQSTGNNLNPKVWKSINNNGLSKEKQTDQNRIK